MKKYYIYIGIGVALIAGYFIWKHYHDNALPAMATPLGDGTWLQPNGLITLDQAGTQYKVSI